MADSNYAQYPRPAVRPSLRLSRNRGEEKTPMTTEADYNFSEGYQQPTFPEKESAAPDKSMPDLGRAAMAGLTTPDEDANAEIIRASLAAIPERITERPPVKAEIPYTYGIESFAYDTNAVYATDQFCTAWLELARRQAKDGDFIKITELQSGSDKMKKRLIPRALAKKIPDGTKAETLEIFLTPDMYVEYQAKGLIPEGIAGENGVPRIYWIRRDGGDAYTAGTNADRIYVTRGMNPLGAATPKGTYATVDVAVSRLPGILSTTRQDELEQEAKEREINRQSYSYRPLRRLF